MATVVSVSAQKEPADANTLPVSITTMNEEEMGAAGVRFVSEAGEYAPNTFFSELSARKVSNPRFRGVGSSPVNPGITTFIDGVPQLNTNSANLELLDVAQVEFVRGPQSALFGRNTVGGLINLTSVKPQAGKLTGSVVVPVGDFGAVGAQGRASGSLKANLVGSFAFGYDGRDGFTTNDATGHVLDDRAATFGKGQVLWTPQQNWEARLIITGERDRDGDYALGDLAMIRANPFHVSRDFEGHTDRGITSVIGQVRHEGARITFTSITGYVHWFTEDLTDLDYTASPLATRDNTERDGQFTQEIRFASAANAPVKLAHGMWISWQLGTFLATQHYQQDAVATFAPMAFSPDVSFTVNQHAPQSKINELAAAIYGETTIGLKSWLDATFSLRTESERKAATLDTFYTPEVTPASDITTRAIFANVTPALAVTFHPKVDRIIYASFSQGFKAGGFNAASPAANVSFAEEHAWQGEWGAKTTLAKGRLSYDTAVFYIDWDNLQVNLPNVAVPGQFYIANVGGATSKGVEFELDAKPREAARFFMSFGYADARFKPGTSSRGVSVSNKRIPNAPDATASLGLEVTHGIMSNSSLYWRAEVIFYGKMQYDDSNTQAQNAYSLVNVRAGVRHQKIFVEVWMRNALDTRYIPVAFEYPTFAPSGFIGEVGRPRTFGVRGGITF
jgi:iron complex outermembrane receptor protein